jgi:RHS repeat-associated protein
MSGVCLAVEVLGVPGGAHQVRPIARRRGLGAVAHVPVASRSAALLGCVLVCDDGRTSRGPSVRSRVVRTGEPWVPCGRCSTSRWACTCWYWSRGWCWTGSRRSPTRRRGRGGRAGAGCTTTPFGFAGPYTDAGSGLLYLGARYYDPATGQFLSRDPALSLSGSVYAYADGDPIGRKDPSGLWTGGICRAYGLMPCPP